MSSPPSASTAAVVAGWPSYSSLVLTSPGPYLVHIELSHGRHNSMTRAFWSELQAACSLIAQHVAVIRVVLLTGKGDIFSAGLDVVDHADLFASASSSSSTSSALYSASSSSPSPSPSPSSVSAPPIDISRGVLQRLAMIEHYQRAFTALELLPQPVLALVHGAAVGGAVDLLTACDVRLATSTASFSVKEVDLGLCADVGTLQRLGKVVGCESAVREWAFTARTVGAEEAAAVGLVSRPLHSGKADGWKALRAMGEAIAAKSPVAVLGTKRALLHARDHSVAEGLAFVAQWNAVHLQSDDVRRAMHAQRTRTAPLYANL